MLYPNTKGYLKIDHQKNLLSTFLKVSRIDALAELKLRLTNCRDINTKSLRQFENSKVIMVIPQLKTDLEKFTTTP
ncbi:hypothetical protein NQ315_007012 [Exocentrus adspersus]|uniref:Uncharacterized protein n=1 Tax=Exocentrus adspersus TaxID=1586481 RepID=A0AAV8WET7_9CUCU|nr:hypothetical protein NQ315_007012 [Exocentrus adspersus]